MPLRIFFQFFRSYPFHFVDILTNCGYPVGSDGSLYPFLFLTMHGGIGKANLEFEWYNTRETQVC